mmetsp:Transcript_2145/g.6206  ORF Transcript_2145/g.6206 Transcript_2145/m.6206 type:complete len:261 (-) Transcript_2145:1658-2440(-)
MSTEAVALWASPSRSADVPKCPRNEVGPRGPRTILLERSARWRKKWRSHRNGSPTATRTSSLRRSESLDPRPSRSKMPMKRWQRMRERSPICRRGSRPPRRRWKLRRRISDLLPRPRLPIWRWSRTSGMRNMSSCWPTRRSTVTCLISRKGRVLLACQRRILSSTIAWQSFCLRPERPRRRELLTCTRRFYWIGSASIGIHHRALPERSGGGISTPLLSSSACTDIWISRGPILPTPGLPIGSRSKSHIIMSSRMESHIN